MRVGPQSVGAEVSALTPAASEPSFLLDFATGIRAENQQRFVINILIDPIDMPGLHYLAGLWQADPIAGMLIAAFLIREG